MHFAYSLVLVKRNNWSMVLILHRLSPGIHSEKTDFFKKKVHEKFYMLSRKILRLSLNIEICISKNMALFLKVLRLTPCFSKCKFLWSETVLEFYAKYVECTKSDFLWKSINFVPFILTSHTHIILISV